MNIHTSITSAVKINSGKKKKKKSQLQLTSANLASGNQFAPNSLFPDPGFVPHVHPQCWEAAERLLTQSPKRNKTKHGQEDK